MNASLIAHTSNPKFAAKFVDYADLVKLPAPVPLSPRHQPIPHAVLVDAIRAEAGRRNLAIAREGFALGNKGMALFGVMDLVRTTEDPNTFALAEGDPSRRGLSFGFRASNDGQLALSAVAGQRVFVCDNLALSGDIFAMRRIHTVSLDLGDALATGFDKFAAQSADLEIQIERLQQRALTDGQAKEVIYDVFAASVLPARLFDDVNRFYFKPSADMPDCEPRTAWGVHNAMTRAVKDLPPVRAFQATVLLGRQLGLTSASTGDPTEPGDVPDGAVA